MNGGTSLRAEGAISRFAASSINSTVCYRQTGRPAVAVFGGFGCPARRDSARRTNLPGKLQWGQFQWGQFHVRVRAAT
jgi:hypothetical protein